MSAVEQTESADEALVIQAEDFGSELAQALIAALNAELSGRYPEKGATHFRLEPDEVAQGRGAFLIARLEGKAVACGAFRLLDAATAEIKRMYVAPEARGLGLGRKILAALEAEARTLGVRRLVLETGRRQEAALELYRKAGFVATEPWGEYLDSPLSLCLEKRLD